MAETAGLVVGGIALASLFESCMTIFDRLDAGKNCAQDYQEDALKITLLGSRLRRWEEAYNKYAPSNNVQDGELAKRALDSVKKNLESLAKKAERYQPADHSNDLAGVTERMQNLQFSSTRSTSNDIKTKPSFRSKIVWALHDKDKVAGIIREVRFKIEELESLSQGLLPILQQQADADADKLNLLPPAYTQQPPKNGKMNSKNDDDDIIALLKRAAAQVDPRFVEAVIKATTGHFYENITATDLARQNSGDHIARGYTGPMSTSRHCFRNIRAEGNARQQIGNMYGRSVFDD